MSITQSYVLYLMACIATGTLVGIGINIYRIAKALEIIAAK